jgi:PncC family amidohydrolase
MRELLRGLLAKNGYNSPGMVETVEFWLGRLLRQLGMRMSVAESCTGGLISHLITNVPGSSDYFLGGLTVYANEAKVRLLGVRWETLEKYGAVSREIVMEMAEGVRTALTADVGLSVSGIAGPGGGTPEKPVGTTWIGLNTARVGQARCFQFVGDRLSVKEQAARMAVQYLAEYLSNQ